MPLKIGERRYAILDRDYRTIPAKPTLKESDLVHNILARAKLISAFCAHRNILRRHYEDRECRLGCHWLRTSRIVCPARAPVSYAMTSYPC